MMDNISIVLAHEKEICNDVSLYECPTSFLVNRPTRP